MTTSSDALDTLLAIRDGYFWARWNFSDAVGTPTYAPGGIGQAVSLTYSFLTAVPYYSSAYAESITGFGAFNETTLHMRTATLEILQNYQEVANLTFTKASGGALGQITFGMNDQAGSSGYAYFPSFSWSLAFNGTLSSVTEQPAGGDVWIANDPGRAWTAGDFDQGGWGYYTLMHELGHALGLKHPFEGSYTLAPSLDTTAFTVMSYTDAPHSIVVDSLPGGYYSYHYLTPNTLMLGDIRALQYLYGANNSTRTGNDTYQWADHAAFLETIWDAGGSDTIDCANQTLSCVIDLNAGHYSSIGLRQTDAELMLTPSGPSGITLSQFSAWFPATVGNLYNGQNNLAIADNVVIENAIGGRAADTIVGNDADNLLQGGAGDDTLTGGAGNDILGGGAGADTMIGGLGSDTYVVDSAGDVVIEAGGGAAGGIDLVKSSVSYTLGRYLENLTLTGSGAIDGTGNALNNKLTGNNAANVLNGGGGADRMSGGLGDDTYIVDHVGDLVIESGDPLNGGTDLVKSRISFVLGNDLEHLVLTGSEAIDGTGNGLDNTLTGNGAANRLAGGAGNDSLIGYGGADTLYGGDGNDVLTGGAGVDMFVFDCVLDATANMDLVTDFAHRADKIALDDDVFTRLGIGTEAGVALAAARFYAGAAAHDANDRIIYDASAGALYYDPDGTGSAGQVQFAVLGTTTHPTLGAGDFIVLA